MRIDKEPVPLPGTVHDPLYPSWDGEPNGESDYHSIALMALRQALDDFYKATKRTDVYVSSGMLLYYEKGVTNSRRDLDLFIVLGASNHSRISFRVWEEGRLPDAVIEIASETTHTEDIGEKFEAYQRLGIREYFLFDPEDRFYSPTLIGYSLENGRYERILPVEGNTLPSRIGVWLIAQGTELRVIDPATGEMVQTRLERIEQVEDERNRAEEALEQAQEARDRAQREQRRERGLRLAAEQRQRELEDELRRLRGLPPLEGDPPLA